MTLLSEIMQAEAEELDVAWDQLHQAGWSPDDVRLRMRLDSLVPEFHPIEGEPFKLRVTRRRQLRVDGQVVFEVYNGMAYWIRPSVLNGPRWLG